MYIIVLDPWGSYVDGRTIEHKELVEMFAKSRGFATQETDKEPVIDLLISPIKHYEEEMKKISMKKVELSKTDKTIDKKIAAKEDSEKDKPQDKKLQAKISKKK